MARRGRTPAEIVAALQDIPEDESEYEDELSESGSSDEEFIAEELFSSDSDDSQDFDVDGEEIEALRAGKFLRCAQIIWLFLRWMILNL